ncbi:flagellar biosynthesis protein FliZ [Desulfocucumis palustris]|uniref:Flagellar protein n=1 Tax=Desulfocucumis palustris TaxID=1898651 RepID=A0A2L2XA95_9FIRM|nr:flagellar biosynthetic protein FliO [Desulfocucumis palustris]GBF33199.1 flagellar biosynthesis protein FliZ [Desulfocucumis palustris]
MTGEMIEASLRLLIVLPLVTAMAYFFIKYGLARRSRILSGTRRMRLVEQLPIGPKTFITLVEVGERYYLLAQHENGVTLVNELNELPGPVAPEESDMDIKNFLSAAGRGISFINSKVAKHRTRE